MKVNWFTVIAQAINFLILVWLLKRYLYKPILNAVDEREKKIASQLEDAKSKKAEAKNEQDEFKEKNDTFDKQKDGLMSKAVAEVKEERKKLLENARNEADALHSKLEVAMNEAQKNLSHEIARKVQQEVFAITRKALTDIASVNLEEQSADIFIKRLTELNDEEKKKFIAAFKSDTNPVIVRSAFDLSAKIETHIQKSVNEIIGAKAHFKFSTEPEVISGIELTANGYKLAWSISEYLNSLEKSISETIKGKAKAEPKKREKELEKKSKPEK